MTRAPIQSLVIPYRRRPDGTLECAVLHRSNRDMWQFVSGGAEDDETPLRAARRESEEEAGIPASMDFITLDSMDSVPRRAFPGTTHWPRSLRVIPEYAFAVDVGSHEIRLSGEHDKVRWLEFDAAFRLLTWESNRTALRELQQRLDGKE